MALVIITLVNFGDIKGIYIITIFLSLGYGISGVLSNDGVPADQVLPIIILYGVSLVIGLSICFVIMHRTLNKLLEIINMKLAAQGIFKHIFDNSNESIIIVKD